MFDLSDWGRKSVKLFLLAIVCGVLGGAFFCPPAVARPTAMKLFPQETLLFARTPNAHELGERTDQTNFARMLRDPQLQPFLNRLYGAADAYSEKLADKLGATWEQLKKLPQGEVAFGIVAREGNVPALVLLVDQGTEDTVARSLLDRVVEKLAEKNGDPTTIKIEGEEVTVVTIDAENKKDMGMFEKDHTIVASDDPGLLREILLHWHDDDGAAGAAKPAVAASPETATDAKDKSANVEEADVENWTRYSGRTLAENEKFVSILRHCRRDNDPPPNLVFFVDPIGMLREFGRDNAGLKIAMATFPALGIDGLSAIGGAMTWTSGNYDGLSQMHVLLDNPRAGVIQIIAFEPGDISPQAWVPEAIETYMTWHWNGRTTYDAITNLIDKFQYPGATAENVNKKLSEPLGIDFPVEVIDNLAGRFTWIVSYDQPARIVGGQQSVIGIELKDQAVGEKVLTTIATKFPEVFEAQKFGNVSYYTMMGKGLRDMDPEARPLTPFVAVMDNYFFIGGSPQVFQQMIAARDGGVDRLADSKMYRRMLDTVQVETPGVKPAFWSYSRFDETLRHWYDVLTSEKLKEQVEQHAEDNPFLKALADSLAAKELPPFEVLAKYGADSCGVLYDTDTGFHGIGFTLKKTEE